jgi:septum formation protein
MKSCADMGTYGRLSFNNHQQKTDLKELFLILASGSRYRAKLLARFGIPFEAWSPEVDEAPRANESPRETAVRLAKAKAQAARSRFPNAWIVGSDQVAELDGQPLGKPGNREAAGVQLRAMRGRTVHFHTAVCLLAGGRAREALVTTSVDFRPLGDAEIERYLDKEPAFDCAGSAKVECLGIALLGRVAGDDPTALVGLPLIALAGMLRAEGAEVP